MMTTQLEDIATARLAWIKKVREAFINCRDLEMREVYEIPIDDWEMLKNAIMSPIRLERPVSHNLTEISNV